MILNNLGQICISFHRYNILVFIANTCDKILVKIGCWKMKLNGVDLSIKNHSDTLNILM